MSYYAQLNRDIESNNRVNWEGLKKLRNAKKESEQMDLQDLSNFYQFFKKLYAEKSLTFEDNVKNSSLTDCLRNVSHIEDLQKELNLPITIEELNISIAKLRKGKAAGEDCITNEFLVYSNAKLRLALLNVFNQCLDNSIYPWNVSIVTPLHKKGDRYNPDNYRAIAVSSALGKLFSNVLLNRLVNFHNFQKV